MSGITNTAAEGPHIGEVVSTVIQQSSNERARPTVDIERFE
jgi:hypothetical protein